MADLTPADLTELRRLLAAATPGPWRKSKNTLAHVVAECGGGVRVAQCGDHADRELRRFNGERWNADAALIAALVTAAPRLIEMAERAVRDPSAGHPATCRCMACFPG